MHKRHKGHWVAQHHGVLFEAIRFHKGYWILWAGPVEVAVRLTKGDCVTVLESLSEAECCRIEARRKAILAANQERVAGAEGDPLPF